MKKVTIIFNFVGNFDKIGGGTSHRYEIIKYFKDYTFKVFCLNQKKISHRFINTEIIDYFKFLLKLTHYNNRFSRSKLLNLFVELLIWAKQLNFFKKGEYDIFHLHGVSFFKNLKSADSLLSSFGLELYKYFINYSKIKKSKLITIHNLLNDKLYNYFIKQFDNIICVDQNIYSYVTEYCKKNNYKKNIWYLANSLDIRLFKPSINNDTSFIVGFVGRIAPTVDINIVNQVIENLPEDIMLNLAVSGDIELLSIPKDKKNIIVNKDLAQENMPQFYNKLDLVINPILHDAVSRVTLEAMACGVPVMMYKYDDRSQYFNNENGIDINRSIDDVIRKVNFYKNNKDILELMSKNARKTIVDNYSNEVLMPKLRSIYEGLIYEAKRN